MAKTVNSMEELAQIAGCSVMTVSYALRNSSQVSKATCQRIQELANKHSYQRNPMVSALMATRGGRLSQSRETIALLTKFGKPMAQWKKTIFYRELYNGMLAKSKELGFGLEEFPTHGKDSYNAQRLKGTLTARGIRGIILMPGGNLDLSFPMIDHPNHCVVAAAFHARELVVHRTASDHASGMALCLREVDARGYKRVGFTLNERMDPEVRYAFSGCYLAWQRRQPKSARVPFIKGTDTLPLDSKTFKAWLIETKPDCVIAHRPECLDWIRECGLKVPEDIGFALLPTRGVKGVSGVIADPTHVGEVTVSLMARELFLNHLGLPKHAETILIRCAWQEANTLRPRLD